MEYIATVIDDDINGNGIVRLNNVVVFIKYAIKGEKIKFKVIKKEKRYWVGELLEIIEKSSVREKVSCPYYQKCGGCTLLHVNDSYENNIKSNYIKNMFTNYDLEPIISNNNLNYRNKITLHIKDGKLGFYNEKSNELIEINNCLLASPTINNLIKEISLLDLTKVTSIVIRCSETTNETMVKFYGNIDPSKLYDKIDVIYVNDLSITKKDYIREVINGITYTIYPESFFQVNTKLMIKLYDIIKLYAKNNNSLLDLYCGTGTIGIYLKENYKNILGIELNEDAIKNANINKKINKIKNINFKCMDCKDIKEDYFDTVILDPPRKGLNKNTIKFLNNMKSKKIIYVSCNPLTLKRDLQLLENTYNVYKISIVNMFNKTSHVESVCILERETS